MRLTWWGHSAVLLELDGVRVLVDPVLRRRVGLLRHVDPPSPGPQDLDAVLVSHLHHDHCDMPTLRRFPAPIVVPPPHSADWFARQGIAGAVDTAVGRTVELGRGVSVTLVPASHSGRREPFGPDALAVGHVVNGPRTSVYLAGDTAVFDGMRDVPAASPRGRIDVAVVPVWGWGPSLGPGHMDPDQAAEAVRLVHPRHAVPVHWGSLHPVGMRRAMRVHLITPGERFVAAVGHHAPGTAVHVLDHRGTVVV